MNTNDQILSSANGLLIDIRKQKEAITGLCNVRGGLSGGSQKNITIHAGGSCIDVGFTGRSYATELQEPYSLAATFIRKGINIEIERRELIVELLTKRLNDLTFAV